MTEDLDGQTALINASTVPGRGANRGTTTASAEVEKAVAPGEAEATGHPDAEATA